LKTERIAIEKLHADPANLRKHGERNLAAIEASLARFGQQTPIVVGAGNVVRKGNGTLEAARRLGWPSLLCVRTKLEGSEATAYAIADNRTAELAEWEPIGLADVLRALQSEGDDLAGATGFAADEVDALCERLGTQILAAGEAVEDPAGEWQGMPECTSEDRRPFRTLLVHLGSQEAVDEFAGLIGQEINPQAKYIWHPEQIRQDRRGERWVEDGEE